MSYGLRKKKKLRAILGLTNFFFLKGGGGANILQFGVTSDLNGKESENKKKKFYFNVISGCVDSINSENLQVLHYLAFRRPEKSERNKEKYF